MRAYILETDEVAVVMTKAEAEKITDKYTDNIISCRESRSLASNIKAALDDRGM